MRRIVMFVVLAVPLAFPATAHAFGCIGGGFGKSFRLGIGRTHRPFSFQIPEAGTLRVELDYSHVTNPTALIVVRLRRSTWRAAKTLVDSRPPAAGCLLAAGTVTCHGARPHTAPGSYHLGVHKLSPAAATVTINACWAAPPAEAGGLTEKFRLPAGPTHRRFVLKVLQAGTVRVRLKYSASSPGAQFLVHLRRSNWKSALTIVDTRREAACALAAGAITCAGARAHTAAGTYFIGVRKLSPGPATVTLTASWP
ncbi:MAG: hypothetical protein ABJB93_03560 [Gaiellales bacterium]